MFSLHIVYHCKPLLESPRKLKEKISIHCQWELFTAFHPCTTLLFSPLQLLRQDLSVDNRLQVAIQTKPFWKSFCKGLDARVYKTPEFNDSRIGRRLSGHVFWLSVQRSWGGGGKSPGDFPIKIPGVSLCLLGVKICHLIPCRILKS